MKTLHHKPAIALHCARTAEVPGILPCASAAIMPTLRKVNDCSLISRAYGEFSPTTRSVLVL